MLGVARSVAGFVQRIDDTARNLNDAINDVRHTVLNQQTLTNLAFTITTLQRVSESAQVVVNNLDTLVSSDTAPVGAVISNLNTFSLQLDALAQSAQNLLNTNQPQITLTVDNLETSTAMLTNLLNDTAHSKGLAGELLFDQQLSSNVSSLVSNLSIAAGNLRSNGLWHFLWRPKPGDATAASSKKTK